MSVDESQSVDRTVVLRTFLDRLDASRRSLIAESDCLFSHTRLP